jgi:two-component system cell cycle sensor histidine kinase/response regulator CckA
LNASEAIGDRDGIIAISTGVLQCSREYLGEIHADRDLSPGLYVSLEVSDTGSGMDAKTQARLFEPFFSTKFTGRGLGLAAVQGIVRGHRGAIKLESDPDRGTTFTVLFPVAEAEGGLPAPKSVGATDYRHDRGTVLLVDDEATIRRVGRRMLERLGFTVLCAADGAEALQLYRDHGPQISLVLLDLTMPHMDGEETLRELRLLDPEACVVLSSGYTEQDITVRFAGTGLAGFVQKPYTLSEFGERLQAALDGWATSGGSVE